MNQKEELNYWSEINQLANNFKIFFYNYIAKALILLFFLSILISGALDISVELHSYYSLTLLFALILIFYSAPLTKKNLEISEKLSEFEKTLSIENITEKEIAKEYQLSSRPSLS